MRRSPSPFVFVEDSGGNGDGEMPPQQQQQQQQQRTLRGYLSSRLHRRRPSQSPSPTADAAAASRSRSSAISAAELHEAELATLLADESFADVRAAEERFVATQLFAAAAADGESQEVSRLLAAQAQLLAWQCADRLPAHVTQGAAETALASHAAVLAFSALFGRDRDIRVDAALYTKIAELQGLPRSFWLQSQAPAAVDDSQWDALAELLFEINKSRSPLHKLACMTRATRFAARLCGSNAGGQLIGADMLLPFLVAGIVHGNPPSLHSNIEFVCRACLAKDLLGEAGYAVVSLQCALGFIEHFDLESAHLPPRVCDDWVLLDEHTPATTTTSEPQKR